MRTPVDFSPLLKVKPLVLMLALAATPLTSRGATFTWDGGGADGNWGMAANWSPDGAPTATGHTFVFAGTTNLNAANNIVTTSATSGTVFTFNSGAGSFNLSGDAITVGSGGGAGQQIVQQSSTSAQTISLNLNFTGGSGDRSIVFASGAGSLTLGGNINFSNDWLFPNTTAGTLILSGNNSGDGKAFNAGGVTAGTNTMNAMMRNNVAGTQLVIGSDTALGNSGSGTASAGTAAFRGIVANQQLNISTTGGARTLPGSSLAINANNITFNGASNITLANVINVGGNRDFVVSSTGSVTLSGGIFLSSDQTGRQLYVNLSGAGGMTVNGAVADTFHSGGLTTGTSTLRKASGGTLRLNGNSTYTAVTQVDAGSLIVNGTHAPAANSGRYFLVNGATLGGTGTIKPFDTTGSLTGLSLAGITAPGDPSVNGGIGTLTFDGSNSTRSVAAFEATGTLAMQLGAFGTADKIALVGGQANDFFFNNNVVNFTDTTSGNLAGGQYVLVSADIANAFSGLTKDGSGFITSGLTIGAGLSAYPGSTLQVVGNNIVLNLPAPAPGAPSALTVTSASGGTALSWTAGTNPGAFTIKRATSPGGLYTTIASGVTATSYVDRNFMPGTTYYYVVVSVSSTGTSANSGEVSATPMAANGTWSGGTGNYSDTTKWSGGTIASGPGATMMISTVGTITDDIAVSLGTITGSWNSSTSLTLQGSGSGAINFATTTGTPALNLTTFFSRYDYLTNLTVTGTQGLSYSGGSNALVVQSGMNWSGFSGGLNLVGPINGDGGMIYAQSANALPATTLTMTPGSGSNGYRHAKLVLNGGANQTIGALKSSIVGTGTAYVSSYSNANLLTGGTPSGTNTAGFSTLTIGADDGSGVFLGKIGTGYNNGSNAEDATANQLNIVKSGAGTQTFAGTNNYIGTTTVSGGTLLIDGTYDQGTGANAGRIFVNANTTLGGTGTVKLSDTNGGTTGFSISGKLAPGDPATNSGVGTFTINGSASARSAVAFEGGGSLLIRLNTGLAASKIALTGGQASDVFFNNNVIDFIDVSAGALSSGAYVIFSADVASAFSGLTTNGAGTITAGLTIGSGLSAYTNKSLQVVGNNIVLNLTNPLEPVPVALSLNVKASANTGMTPVETAGATGARFSNWNNLNVSSGSGSITNLVDSTGAQVTGVSATLAAGNSGAAFSRGLASPTNDVRVFDTVLDKFDGTAATLTVTGIPYGTYDVYFYMADDGTARGGSFTVGGTTYYLRGGAGTPTSSGTGYVQSTDTTYNAGADTQANYVKFTGLSGTLTATFTAVNEGDSVQRLKFPGFQIVGTAAPASSAPAAPAGVTITANSATSFTIGWAATNGATGYQIFRSTTAGSFDFNNPLATIAAPGLSFTDTAAVAGTTYYYVVRAANGVGSSTASTELSTPPPNLDSVAVSSPVIWPGGSSTLSWAIPNAATLTIDDGTGAQAYATTGTLTVTPASTATYTFTGTNAQGATTKAVSVTIVPKPNARDALWQWSIPLTGIVSSETNDYPRAFLYIPPGVTTVRGVIVAQHNLLEEPLLEHPAVRQGLADAGMAAIWISPAIDGSFNFTANPNTPVIFQQMMDGLAAESGYAELSKTPVVWIGHSAMAEAPYFFAAWDSQNAAVNSTPRRCAAAISIKGWYPGKHDATTPTYANSDLAGVPLMYIEGEYADANGRASAALSFKNATPGSILSFFADVGGGHFDWNENVCSYIGMYLRKLGQYRLPATAAADGTATLQAINPSTQGWLADRWRKGQSPTADPAGVGSYSGNASEAFWYFDQEHAETTHNGYLPVKTQYQLLGYTQNGVLVNQNENHEQVDLSFIPDPTGDGLTFKLGTAFLNTVPVTSSRLTGWTGLPVGSAIGHASGGGPILISPITGPVEQLAPDTFRVQFQNFGTSNIVGQTRSRDIWFQSVHPGDSTYVRAVQQSLLRFTLPLTSGAAQTITFAQPADQLNGVASVNLSATTSGTATYSGAKVYFYVREGAAKVNGDTLEFTTLPPRTKFPAKVTVVATQYGRTIAPLLQTATPVKRTFWIHKNALEKWRYENFGTLTTDANGEQSWTLAADSGDSSDPDGDGQSNLLEFAFGTDQSVSDAGPLVVSGATLMTHGMPAVNVDTQPTSVNFTARFVRRKDWQAAGLTYAVQFSGDLAEWQTSTAPFTLVAQDATHEVISVPYPYFVNGRKARFFRVVVTAP
jgi:autotransporter-associated beta strand protein